MYLKQYRSTWMLSLFWIQASLPNSAVNTLLAWICNVLNYSYWSSYFILKSIFFSLKKNLLSTWKFSNCMWDQIKGSEYRLDWRSWVLVQTLNSCITNPAISLSLGLLSQAIPPPQHLLCYLVLTLLPFTHIMMYVCVLSPLVMSDSLWPHEL